MSTETVMQCPAPGCDYEGPNVKQHWGGMAASKDPGGHEGSFQAALQRLDAEADPPDPSVDATENAGGGQLEEDPTLGGGRGVPDLEEDDDLPSDYELPCGHEEVDLSGYTLPLEVTCETCRASWTLEEEEEEDDG